MNEHEPVTDTLTLSPCAQMIQGNQPGVRFLKPQWLFNNTFRTSTHSKYLNLLKKNFL